MKNRTTRWKCISAVFVLSLLWIAMYGWTIHSPEGGVLLGWGRTEADPQGAMPFDPKTPFTFVFGRGSGWDGLDIVSVSPDGAVIIDKANWSMKDHVLHQSWDSASIQVPAQSLEDLANLVASSGICRMKKAYHTSIKDGTQWVLQLSQGGRSKAIYFNNHFPAAILSFAGAFDRWLDSSGLAGARWFSSGELAAGRQERSDKLWLSIRSPRPIL